MSKIIKLDKDDVTTEPLDPILCSDAKAATEYLEHDYAKQCL